ncbi:MAG: hypothetical protein CV089_24220, partial [Nitrospira sp. WS110]|nr:hypothetical protein [Nitrospira sp. WS110]
PDVTVQVRAPSEADHSELGIAIAVTDRDNYYAITLQPGTGLVTTRRVTDGQVTVLGQVTAKLAPKTWHTMRIQRINFLHLEDQLSASRQGPACGLYRRRPGCGGRGCRAPSGRTGRSDCIRSVSGAVRRPPCAGPGLKPDVFTAGRLLGFRNQDLLGS